MKKSVLLALTAVAGAVVLSGCAGMDKSASEGANGDPFATASFQKILKNDFVSKGQASVDRLKQTKACGAWRHWS